MKPLLRALVIGFAAFIFAASFLVESAAQRGGRVFNHSTSAHKQARDGKPLECNWCHTLPTSNWQQPRPDGQAPFPDVRNYPFNRPGSKAGETHTACFGCHISDLYANGGSFCAGCHTVAGPRARGGSGVRPFPNPAHQTQFTTIFPHDVHQDVLAFRRGPAGVAVAHFVLVSHTAAAADNRPEFYNCSVCHQTAARLPKYATRKPMSDETPPKANNELFVPKPQYFKDEPTSHASCFSCHYQRTQPVSTDCAGCHRLESKPPLDSPVVARYSLKFDHEQLGIKVQVGERVHSKDCMTCHLRTAASSDLQLLKSKTEPEVPFSSCVSCHSDDIADQLKKRDADKTFQCNYCHTSAIGRYKTPDSHLTGR